MHWARVQRLGVGTATGQPATYCHPQAGWSCHKGLWWVCGSGPDRHFPCSHCCVLTPALVTFSSTGPVTHGVSCSSQSVWGTATLLCQPVLPCLLLDDCQPWCHLPAGAPGRRPNAFPLGRRKDMLCSAPAGTPGSWLSAEEIHGALDSSSCLEIPASSPCRTDTPWVTGGAPRVQNCPPGQALVSRPLVLTERCT